MQRKKRILWSALIGAFVSVLIVRLTGGVPLHVQNFGLGDSPLGKWQLVVAATPWVIFSLYWEIAAKNATAAKSSEARASRAVHVVLGNVALLLEIIPFHFGGRFVPLNPLVITGGGAVTVLGLFFAIWARGALGRHWSGEITIKVEHELIRSGPYKLVRHPIYTGILIMYAGTAVVTGTNLAIAGFVLSVIAYLRKMGLEEPNLRVAFGPKYDEYCLESWALVPWVY
jgi:protein-S-isoprenylcysteine O-methyltransferase Ste14